MINTAIDYLRIGKIVNTQGIGGEVKVIPLTDDVERFNDLKYVYLDDEKLIRMDIQYVRFHKNLVLVKFKGIDSINEAEKYKNTYMLIDRENAVKLPEGSYFICDMIGVRVYSIDGSCLGKINDIMTTGSNDVYVVKGDDGDILIPALKSVVREINIKEDRIVVELPEGLIDNED